MPAGEVAAPVLLAAVLVFAVLRPRGLPEAVAAVPAAGLVLLLGSVSPADALGELVVLGPTVAFLAAILLLGRLAEAEGVFDWLGGLIGARSSGSPGRLLALVFAAAALVTAVLSLDATVVLLTPVVLAAAGRLGVSARPHVYACAHLANSASLLLPVSNLTNLLAFAVSGLSFTAFAALMAAPWLVVLAVEFLVLRRWFRRELAPRAEVGPAELPRAPRLALAVLGLTLVGFAVSSFAGVEPVWVAAVGALVLAVHLLAGHRVTPWALVRGADPLFCLFVLALAIVVEAVAASGLGAALAAVLPVTTTLPGLLGIAALAAVLAAVVNNIPATLVLLAVLGADPGAGVVLAVLIGVNIGPNLTYTGSLATLLWRRVLAGTDAAPRLREFTALGVLTVPLALVGAVLVLWVGLRIGGFA